jgi:hypothetical protein
MTTNIRAFVMFGLLAAAALPAAAQSANRTGAGAAPATRSEKTLAQESDAVQHCRVHCQQLASASNAAKPRASVGERQARQSHCAKRMM